MVEMSLQEFEDAVSDALDQLPEAVIEQIDNVVVLVEDEPDPQTPDVLGIYDGVPLTERDGVWAVGALPDRIIIYRNPTLRMCESHDEVVKEVLITVVHEVAHYFGIDDDRLHELGWS